MVQRCFAGDQWESPINDITGKFITRCDGSTLGLATAALLVHHTFAKENLTIKTKNVLLNMISELIGYEMPRYTAN